MSERESAGYPWPESLKGLLIGTLCYAHLWKCMLSLIDEGSCVVLSSEDLLGKRSTGDLKSDMVSRVVFVLKDDTIKEVGVAAFPKKRSNRLFN